MEDTKASNGNTGTKAFELGMSSFDAKERREFGRNIRLAMACIEGKPKQASTLSLPMDATSIRQRLSILSQNITSQHADLLELLVRFDDVKGWQKSRSKHCVAWMNLELGIGKKLAWEYLKVGRQLRELPTTTALFRAGKLSWSKVRAIARVADKDNEKLLCHAALDASASDVSRLCREYQWSKDKNDEKSENDRASKQWASRSLIWKEASNGSTCIQLTLPPEAAQAFLSSIEHSRKLLNDSEPQPEADLPVKVDKPSENEQPQSSMAARRADAAILMAETSLQADSHDIAAADRYQVIVSVEADDLHSKDNIDKQKAQGKRPSIRHAGPIARETARRIACDCSVTNNVAHNGEPVSIGRKSRLWPAAMARAIKNRDRHCQFYGCTQTRNLQIHHIKHWADGGTTSIDNGVCLCQACHTKVHEGGFRIQTVSKVEQRLNEQFTRQQHGGGNVSDLEQNLRDDRESFDKVRSLLATTHRFRIIDSQGRDVRDNYCYESEHAQPEQEESTRIDSTHAESRHAQATENAANKNIFRHPWFIREQQATYQSVSNLH